MMNLRNILTIVLLVLILVSFLDAGFLLWTLKNSTKEGKAVFAENSWLFWLGIATNVAALVTGSGLFVIR